LYFAPQRNEYQEFWRNNQYTYVDEKNNLQRLPTATSATGVGKPRWLHRRTANLTFHAVEHAVSACTSRVPSYAVAPSTVDQEDKSAAELAEKVAIFGHDKWSISQLAARASRTAIVMEESFAWPCWDSSVGPYIEGTN